MKLTKTAEYALTALLQLADYSGDEPVSSHRLARRAALPERYFLQVLRSLVTHGLLQSTRGVVGGYRLCVPLNEISLLQVMEITDGPIRTSVAPSSALPPRVIERINRTLAAVATAAEEQLAGVSLADLTAEQDAPDQTAGRADATATREDGPEPTVRETHLRGCNCGQRSSE
ncbi:HTH-type transcriptional regulator CymR [Posidoniimonas polymericola]|uniref:HTH-type transcriptional regulator CymR n=1 Tax=Posidoniimonas polymericola TaxID=2528002 RepID=A0A5C5ZDG9_9BACT|nr:Rrf2 family transcriptional regulator [Posidoniimonas polymericola]TWT85394.1 HTH-type transcriptional regulator CymR [Posidoniimonas polymericola]